MVFDALICTSSVGILAELRNLALVALVAAGSYTL